MSDMIDEVKSELTPWGNTFMMSSDIPKMRRESTIARLNLELDSIICLRRKVELVKDFTEKLMAAHAHLA